MCAATDYMCPATMRVDMRNWSRAVHEICVSRTMKAVAFVSVARIIAVQHLCELNSSPHKQFCNYISKLRINI